MTSAVHEANSRNRWRSVGVPPLGPIAIDTRRARHRPPGLRQLSRRRSSRPAMAAENANGFTTATATSAARAAAPPVASGQGPVTGLDVLVARIPARECEIRVDAERYVV